MNPFDKLNTIKKDVLNLALQLQVAEEENQRLKQELAKQKQLVEKLLLTHREDKASYEFH